MTATQDFSDCKVINNTMLVNGTLTSPQITGSPEKVFIGLNHLEAPAPDTSYYMVVKAVDSHGNMGADSNLAQLQGPVTPEKNSAAIIAGVLAGIAIIGTAIVGGVLIQYSKRKKIHTVV